MRRVRSCLLLAILLLCVCFLLWSCSGQAKPTEFGPDDLALYLNDHRFYLYMDIQDVIAILGEDYEFAQAISC